MQGLAINAYPLLLSGVQNGCPHAVRAVLISYVQKVVFRLSDDWCFKTSMKSWSQTWFELDSFKNSSYHPRMCLLRTLSGKVDNHNPFDLSLYISYLLIYITKYFSLFYFHPPISFGVETSTLHCTSIHHIGGRNTYQFRLYSNVSTDISFGVKTSTLHCTSIHHMTLQSNLTAL